MSAASVKVTVDLDGYGKIEIDGRDISNAVEGFTVDASAGKGVTLLVQLSITEIDITSLGDGQRNILVNLSDEVISSLIMLGWQPPADGRRVYKVEHPKWEAQGITERTAEGIDLASIDLASPDAND